MKNLTVLVLFLLLTGCKKDTPKTEPEPTPATPPPVTNTPGKIQLEFNNMVDLEVLVFNKNYVNPKGDTFTVSKFRYYISNIVLWRADNVTYTEPESYHLIDHSVLSTNKLIISNVPAGPYTDVSFMIGIDSARSASGAQTGDLDVAKGMYWTWNSGYVFVELEGKSPQAASNLNSISYHIGGYSGPNKAQRYLNVSFGATRANISSSSTPTVGLRVNVNEIFKTPTVIDFSVQSAISSPGPSAKVIADNYTDMISLDKVQNP